SDAWFTHQLALRLKKLYAGSAAARDQGFINLLWDFDFDPGSYPADTRIQGEPSAQKVMREMHGYLSATKELLAGFADLKDDGSTTCASWIYSGVLNKDGTNKAQNRKADPNNSPGSHRNWAFS